MSWEDALKYAENLTYASASDWRLPNIKELQSINDESVGSPSVDKTFFPSILVKKYWSSTTLPNQTAKAWYLNTQFGITSYDDKTLANYVICVRGNTNSTAQKELTTTKVKVYPNPFHSFISISGTHHDKEITLCDILGKVVYKGNNIENQDFTNLQNGVYFLQFDDNKEVLKLLKE